MWRGVTAVSTLRDDLTFIVSVSLRKYDILTLPHYYFGLSSFHQKIQELMQIQDIPRISKVL